MQVSLINDGPVTILLTAKRNFDMKVIPVMTGALLENAYIATDGIPGRRL